MKIFGGFVQGAEYGCDARSSDRLSAVRCSPAWIEWLDLDLG